ncbi:MAG TPA: class I SAM-dependent methyltransferase [Solirubrobacteraceae bacterium]
MSAKEQLPTWESEEFAAAWVGEDVLADMLLLPRQLSASLVADAGVQVTHVIDLGSGPGGYLDTLLESFPRARGTWVDTSETMETTARERLARFGSRVAYQRGDIEALRALELEPAEVVVTSRVVHHFSAESIQDFYRAVYDLLEPGGFVFNLDHYGSPEGWESRYRRIREQFTGKPKRDIPPHRHDHPFKPIPEHLGWLAEAGFEAPDVPWRTFYTALVAARKPA